MSGTPLLSVVFYVVNKNPQNRIRSKSCRNQKKTPEIRRFQVLFCPVLIKKMQHPRVFQRSSQAAKPQKAGSDQSRGECACKRTGGGSAALCREGGAKQTLLQRGRSVIKGSVKIQ